MLPAPAPVTDHSHRNRPRVTNPTFNPDRAMILNLESLISMYLHRRRTSVQLLRQMLSL